MEIEQLQNALSQTLIELRRKKGFTQEALSIKSGVSRSYISEIEGKSKQPTVTQISKIAEGFNMTLGQFFLIIDGKLLD